MFWPEGSPEAASGGQVAQGGRGQAGLSRCGAAHLGEACSPSSGLPRASPSKGGSARLACLVDKLVLGTSVWKCEGRPAVSPGSSGAQARLLASVLVQLPPRAVPTKARASPGALLPGQLLREEELPQPGLCEKVTLYYTNTGHPRRTSGRWVAGPSQGADAFTGRGPGACWALRPPVCLEARCHSPASSCPWSPR